MIGFILKGVLRDRSRSLFPILVVAAGSMLTVFFYSYMQGGKNNFIDTSARYQTGHLKVMSRAYAAEAELLPNDLSLTEISALLNRLRTEYPDFIWAPRIRFSGLLDIPDEQGETRIQGPMTGLAVELLNNSDQDNSLHSEYSAVSIEAKILNLQKGLISGRLPLKSREILVPSALARSLNIKPGDRATIISSTMTGALAIADFSVAGIIRFGITPLDKSLVIADLSDIQQFLDMEDSAGEVFGFFPNFLCNPGVAALTAREFNQKATLAGDKTSDGRKDNSSKRSAGKKGGEVAGTLAVPDFPEADFQPVMLTLGEQGGLADMIAVYDMYSLVLVAVFVAVMSIVLWNAGLMASLRRYGEIGLRLAMGETRAHLYHSLLSESLIIGLLGSALGTALGLAISYYLQAFGINAEAFTKSSEMMMTNIIKAQVTRVSHVIGFIPGLLATLLGTAIAGLGVFKRKTATLMKEFEA